MEAGEDIVSAEADQGSKGLCRAEIARFELCKGVEIERRRRIGKGLFRQQLERAQRLSFASQHEISDRAPTKGGRLLGRARAGANARSELLVGSFKPSGRVDRIPVSRVVEKPAAAEVTDDGWPRVNPDPGRT